MNPNARLPRFARGGGRIHRPYAATWLLFTAACGGQFDIGHDAADSGALPDLPDSSPVAVYAEAGSLVGSAAAPDGGATMPAELATQQGSAGPLASDGTRIYWAATSGSNPLLADTLLRGCDPSDCRGTLVTYAEDGRGISAIASDGVNVYWAAAPQLGSIVACPVSGCPASGPQQLTPIVEVSALLSDGPALVTDGSYLYWTETDNTVQRCPTTGCTGAPEVVALFDAYPFDLAVDDSSVYVLTMLGAGNSYVGRVFAVDKSAGATPRLIADNQANASSLAAAGGRVYWTTPPPRQFRPDAGASPATGQVLACDAAGCAGAPSVLASGQQRPQSLVVDATRAYFLTESPTSANPDVLGYMDVVACPLTGCGSSPTVLTRMDWMSPPMVGTQGGLFWINTLVAGSATIEGIAK